MSAHVLLAVLAALPLLCCGGPVVRGRVVSCADRRPIPGARVVLEDRVAGNHLETVTARDGGFAVHVPNEPARYRTTVMSSDPTILDPHETLLCVGPGHEGS